MARGQIEAVAVQIGRLFGAGTVSGLDEPTLLERFVTRRDEVAFEALVARHGPMVLSVCRRFLPDPHDAEDAFQATFLVLVRRAGSIRDPGRLGPWLYGVALKVAGRARREIQRRRATQVGGDAVAAFEPARVEASELVGPELHEELGRLPEKYRSPIVLCDLEGHTHEEAARLLNWPVGTVKGRLSRARDQLRSRLLRRGLTPSVGGLALALSRDASAALPQVLIDSTVRAAMVVAAGGGAVGAGLASASAVSLSEGVVRAMILGKLKVAAALMMATGLVAGGGGVFAYQQGGGFGGRFGAAAPASKSEEDGVAKGNTGVAQSPRPDAPEDEIEAARKKLEEARVAVMLKEFQRAAAESLSGGDTQSPRGKSLTIMQAQLERADSPEARVAAAEGHLDRMVRLRDWAAARGKQQKLAPPLSVELDLFMAEAQLWLAEAKAGRAMSGLGVVGEGVAASGLIGGRGVGFAAGAEVPADPVSQADDPQNKAIVAALEKAVSMPFQNPTPLGEVLKYLRTATVSPELPTGLPIYVDPSTFANSEDGLTAETALEKPVTMDLEGVRLKTTLRLLLKQVRLGYIVKDGIVLVGRVDSESWQAEASFRPGEGGVPGYGEMPRFAGPMGGMRGMMGGGATMMGQGMGGGSMGGMMGARGGVGEEGMMRGAPGGMMGRGMMRGRGLGSSGAAPAVGQPGTPGAGDAPGVGPPPGSGPGVPELIPGAGPGGGGPTDDPPGAEGVPGVGPQPGAGPGVPAVPPPDLGPGVEGEPPGGGGGGPEQG
jgi:RNA polymerase sigma factor (sigma-70 family)